MLDHNSEGVGVEIYARVAGRTVSLVPLKKVMYTPSGSAPISAVFGTLPLRLGPGDQLVLRATLMGEPQDDWCNVNFAIGFSGGPILLLAPRSVFTTECDQVGLQAIVAGSGPLSYRWQRSTVDQPDEYVDVQNGPTPGGSIITGATQSTLRVVGPTNPDRGSYRCLVTGSCAQVLAGPADVQLCPADFNCDGLLDVADYIEFEACLEGDCTPGRTADFNGDGFADIYDLSEFVAAFEVGC